MLKQFNTFDFLYTCWINSVGEADDDCWLFNIDPAGNSSEQCCPTTMQLFHNSAAFMPECLETFYFILFIYLSIYLFLQI